MNFVKYTGNDKYHFRYYRKSHNHPFLVIMVTGEYNKDGKIYLSGFNMTHSHDMYEKRPHQFIELFENPNSQDDAESFLNTHLVTAESIYFSKPIRNWHLSKVDEETIDELLKESK